MKRIALCALALVIAASAASPLFADETSEVWKKLYENAQSLQDRYEIMLNISRLNDPGMAGVVSDALSALVREEKLYKSASDKDVYSRLVSLTCNLLGDYKYADAAENVYYVAMNSQSPDSRADALIALGKMRALEYVDQIVITLRNLNFSPIADKQYGEKVAMGCIVSLEKYRDIRGYSPVFYATFAWYSQYIRVQAERSLLVMVDDPTGPITDILTQADTPYKYAALKYEDASKASDANKVSVAKIAIKQGQTLIPKDKKEAILLCDLRKKAIGMLIALKSKDDSSVPLLKKAYESGYDTDEKLVAVQALSVIATDLATSTLADFLNALGDRKKSGIWTQDDERMLRAVIQALGATKNKKGRDALLAIKTSPATWPNAIISLATDALSQSEK
jgi:hypothetical protein